MYSNYNENNRNENTTNIKKNIKTLILLTPEVVGEQYLNEIKYKKEKKEKIIIDEKSKPNGYMYNIFEIIKRKLNNKYIFDIEYSKIDIENYDNIVKLVYNGNYDIIIGSFYINNKREKLVNYTHPLYNNANSIIHIKKNNGFKILIKSIYYISKPIIILIILGLIFGIILFLIEPNRSSYLQHVRDDTRFGKFKRTILTSIAAFLGEMGFLSEQSTLRYGSMLFTLVIIITVFIVSLLIQVRLNAAYIKIEEEVNNLEINKINSYKLLGYKGNAESKKIEKLGANVEYVENISEEKLIQKYLNNKDKYNGVILSYNKAYPHINENLGITYKGLGIEECSWVVSQQHNDLLNDMNYELLKLRENKISYSLCKQFIKLDEGCIL